MRRVGVSPLLVLLPALVPDLASACAVCLDSAWGNRGFGWPFVGLMLAPFAVVAALVGILARAAARGARDGSTPRGRGTQPDPTLGPRPQALTDARGQRRRREGVAHASRP